MPVLSLIVGILSAGISYDFDLKTEVPIYSLTPADGDTVVVKSIGADLSYDVTEIRAQAGSTLTIRYENWGEMPHNIVLVNERADINPVGVAALQANDTDYIPQGESVQERILANTVLAKPGDTVFLTITVPPPGTYPYICSYPGHFTMMQGKLISE
ncbi:MAG: plastocyanin/azurin family copper-binding protein [Balneolaceae bacterium]|nr:plastocyanin/azurin family copper-binding protein [Balneolaceae bacterium]